MISFKNWLTNEFQGGSENSDVIRPEDNGLKRLSYSGPLPISKRANKLFGIRKKCKKK